MRIWSLHPKYLDAKGLVAVWRESLLAQKVLEGKTKGYKNHPQLNRFKTSNRPIESIGCYLSHIYEESSKRDYNFDKNKIQNFSLCEKFISVTERQMKFELKHLLSKLAVRDNELFQTLKNIRKIEPHPLFKVVDGDIENWEIFEK